MKPFRGLGAEWSQKCLTWSQSWCSVSQIMEASTNNVYQYESSQQFLLDSLAEKQKVDPSFSVRRWSQLMGFKSHSLLVMLLKNKRKIRLQHCDYFAKGMGLGSNELAYLKTLVQFENSSSSEEKNLISNFLNDLHPGDGFTSIEVDNFKVVSNWVYMAILAMTDLKNFKGTEEEITKLLGGKATLSEVRSALVRLLDMKLLDWAEDGSLKPTHRRVTTTDDVRNEGAREYHKQVSQLAMEAVEGQHVNDREFQAFALAVPKEKLPLAKEMIRQFRSKFSKAISGNGDNVYQMNIQFFQLTQNPSQRVEVRGVAMDSKTKKEKENV